MQLAAPGTTSCSFHPDGVAGHIAYEAFAISFDIINNGTSSRLTPTGTSPASPMCPVGG